MHRTVWRLPIGCDYELTGSAIEWFMDDVLVANDSLTGVTTEDVVIVALHKENARVDVTIAATARESADRVKVVPDSSVILPCGKNTCHKSFMCCVATLFIGLTVLATVLLDRYVDDLKIRSVFRL